MVFPLPNYQGCRNIVIEITLRVPEIAFAPSVNFVKYQSVNRSALPMNMLCCKAKAMKGLITFQFIAYQGGDKNGNFLNAILLLSLLKLYTVCWGHPRTDMIASLKQFSNPQTKNISLKNFPLTTHYYSCQCMSREETWQSF